MSKLSLILHTFSITGSVASLFLTRAQVSRTNNTKALRQQVLWPQSWPKRQEASLQWVLTGPASIEEVERTNIVMVCLTQQARFVFCN